MSNATITQGAISFPVSADVEKFRLVTVGADGKIKHAAATGNVIGAVTERGTLDPAKQGNSVLAVHYGQHAVKLETADAFKPGEAVYAAADGKAAKAGTVQVGVTIRATEDGRVLTVLNRLPAPGPATP